MHRYENATIETDKETAKIYEWALGEYETIRDDDGNVVEQRPINPLKFPLHGAQVTHNGSRAVISLPRPGKPNLILDRLVHAPEPKVTAKGDKEIVAVSGESERLYNQQIAPEHAQVSFTITEFSGRVVSGMAG